MDEQVKKKVDESWKDQVQQERQADPVAGAPAKTQEPAPSEQEMPEAKFDLFLSGLAMDALIALGDMPHPAARKQAVNLVHARYLVDLLGMIEEKTRGNLTADEERLMKDTLYQLRMRYLAKSERRG